MIPFLDIKAQYQELADEIDSAIHRVSVSGWYVLGSEVEAFEQEYAEHCGVRHCVGVANGLDALHLALRAAGIGEGDEVIVPSNTYIATWLAISHCGAAPVPVEPVESTHNIDPTKVEAAITKRTKAILAVHLYGQPADLDPLLEIALRRKLYLVEDAAQAHGARYKGTPIGGHGHLVAWSFYPSKNLGAMGDAGAITTNDDALADKLKTLRNYGSRVRYVNEVRGWNSRLDPIQAAVLRVKLRHLLNWNARRARIAEVYSTALAGVDLTLPTVLQGTTPAWHLYVVRHSRRDWLQSSLRENGIETLIHYPIPPHMQTAYADLAFSDSGFPVAERVAAEVLSLPIGPHLPDTAAARIAERIAGICGRG